MFHVPSQEVIGFLQTSCLPLRSPEKCRVVSRTANKTDGGVFEEKSPWGLRWWFCEISTLLPGMHLGSIRSKGQQTPPIKFTLWNAGTMPIGNWATIISPTFYRHTFATLPCWWGKNHHGRHAVAHAESPSFIDVALWYAGLPNPGGPLTLRSVWGTWGQSLEQHKKCHACPKDERNFGAFRGRLRPTSNRLFLDPLVADASVSLVAELCLATVRGCFDQYTEM